MPAESTEFDAYYVLLGIAPKDQPPNYYRLLGLELFESDVDIITMAAERQMGYLMPHESGDHIDDVARLASEVSRARLCLLNPEKKKDYDESLAAKIEAQAEPETENLSENHRGLAHFAESSEQNVPVPLSSEGFRIGSKPAVPVDDDPLAELEVVDETASELEPLPARPQKPTPSGSSPNLVPAIPRSGSSTSVSPQQAPQLAAAQDKPLVAEPVQSEPKPANNSEEPWIKRNLWIVIAGGTAALLLFLAALVAIVIVLASKDAVRETAEVSQQERQEELVAATLETPDVPVADPSVTDQEQVQPDVKDESDSRLAETPVKAEIPKPIEILRIEPKMPLAGDSVGVWLPTDLPEDVRIEYRDSSSSSWRSVARPRRSSSLVGGSLGSGSGTSRTELTPTPSFTVYGTKAGILKIDVRATNADRISSPISTVEVAIADNPWARWRETARISHSQGVEQIDFISAGKQVLVTSKQPSTSSTGELDNAVTQFTTWDMSDVSLLNDASTLDTLAGTVREDGDFVAIRQHVETNSTGSAALPDSSPESNPLDEISFDSFEGLRSRRPRGTSSIAEVLERSRSGRLRGAFVPGAPSGSSTEVTNVLRAEIRGRSILLAKSPNAANRVAFSPNGRFVAVAFDSRAVMWDLGNEQALSFVDDPSQGGGNEPDAVAAAEPSEEKVGVPSGTGADGSAASGLPPLFEFACAADAPLSFDLKNSLIACGGSDVKIWQVAEGNLLRTLATPAECLAFTHDGQTLATSSSGEIKIWNVATGELKSTIGCQLANRVNRPVRLARSTFGADYIGANVSQLCFHPLGNELVAVVDNRTAVFRVADGRRLHDLGSSSGINSMRFSPDGSTLATGGADRTVRLHAASISSTTKYVRANPPPDAQSLRADQLIAARQFARALDVMQLSRYVSSNATFTEVVSSGYYRPLYTALDTINKLTLADEIRGRFDLIRSELTKEHTQLAVEEIRKAESAEDQELANFKVYARFPDELLPSEFLKTQRELHIDREKAALRYWERAKALMIRSKRNKLAARGFLLKIVAMEDYLPESAKQARAKMEELGLKE